MKEPGKVLIFPIQDGHPLKQGGGGGSYDGMEPRIAALEAHMDHVRADVADIKGDVKTLRTDTASMKTTIATLPQKGFIAVVVLGGMGLFAAVIAFADQIKHLLSLH